MTSVTADDKLSELLSQVKGLVEVRDARGKVIGFFAPVAVESAPQYARAAAHIDRAELQRRKEAKEKGRTTKEVFERLKDLTSDEDSRTYLQQKIDGLTERDRCDIP